MKLINQYTFFTVCALTMIFSACRDQQWDEHNKISDEGIAGNLLAAIQAYPEGSNFYEAVVKVGYEDLLAQAANFTVFVPNNAAWQNVNTNDDTALKNLVANHIAYGKFLSSLPELYNSLQMVNSKVVKYDSGTQTFNGSKIVSADHSAGNGVFHVIDKVMDLKMNIWEYVSGMTGSDQAQYLRELNHQVMDMEKSIQKGVDAIGRPVYDTIWMNVNNFLQVVPLDDETEESTYIVLKNDGFNFLFNKYRKYFTCSTDKATDSLTRFNVCQDFIFKGIRDISQLDEDGTLTNIFGVKTPLKDAIVENVYEASNGRVYVIDQSNILLREKFKPIIIEGEDFRNSSGNDLIFVRYKLWANGTKDIMLACSTTQIDTIHVVGSQGQDSSYVANRNFTTYEDNRFTANMSNFWIEYKASVYAINYEIFYVAYNDIVDHFSNPNQTLRIEQKLFVSMPGKDLLRRNSTGVIENNYLSDICFVSQDTAGIHQERKMTQWKFNNSINFQYITEPVNEPDASILKVDQTGEMTLWLCNTPRNFSSPQGALPTNAQGVMFLDYIKLVPILEEPEVNYQSQ